MDPGLSIDVTVPLVGLDIKVPYSKNGTVFNMMLRIKQAALEKYNPEVNRCRDPKKKIDSKETLGVYLNQCSLSLGKDHSFRLLDPMSSVLEILNSSPNTRLIVRIIDN